MVLYGEQIEKHSFKFGFVIPNTENSWESTLVAKDKEDMISAEILSGNLIVESEFFNEDLSILKFSVKMFYD